MLQCGFNNSLNCRLQSYKDGGILFLYDMYGDLSLQGGESSLVDNVEENSYTEGVCVSVLELIRQPEGVRRVH